METSARSPLPRIAFGAIEAAARQCALIDDPQVIRRVLEHLVL